METHEAHLFWKFCDLGLCGRLCVFVLFCFLLHEHTLKHTLVWHKGFVIDCRLSNEWMWTQYIWCVIQQTSQFLCYLIHQEVAAFTQFPPGLSSDASWPDVYLAWTSTYSSWQMSGDVSSGCLNTVGILYYWFDNKITGKRQNAYKTKLVLKKTVHYFTFAVIPSPRGNQNWKVCSALPGFRWEMFICFSVEVLIGTQHICKTMDTNIIKNWFMCSCVVTYSLFFNAIKVIRKQFI